MSEKKIHLAPESPDSSDAVDGQISDVRKRVGHLLLGFDDVLDRAADSLGGILSRGGANVAHNLGGAIAASAVAFGTRIMAWEKPKKHDPKVTHPTNQAA